MIAVYANAAVVVAFVPYWIVTRYLERHVWPVQDEPIREGHHV